MNIRIFFVLVLLIFSASLSSNAQTAIEDKIAFTVVKAPWLMIMDSKNFEIRRQNIKPDGKSAYYLLTNSKTGLTVTFFIESADKCKTSEQCRDFVWKTGNPKWGKIQDVAKSQINGVSYFEFFRPVIGNRPLRVFDMYAEFVEADYWIDLHISKAGYKKDDHKLFENVVKSIKFVGKTSKPNSTTEELIGAAQKSADDWMILWDAGKYKESHDILSSYTKAVIKPQAWFEHWSKMRKPLGKLKSRKLLRIQLLSSIPGLSGRSGAGFSYQSTFENSKSIYETFSMSLEKDGNWKVAYYNTNY